MTGIYAVDLGIVLLALAAITTAASMTTRTGRSLWRLPKGEKK